MRDASDFCSVPHKIEEGVCVLCERDKAIRDARRYRALRALIRMLNADIGRLLDEELDRRVADNDL